MNQWDEDASQPWTRLDFDQFGLHAALAVKTIQAYYYKAGGDRLLTIVLVRDLRGKAARPDVLLHQTRLDRRRRFFRPTPVAGRLSVPSKLASNSLAFEDPANRLIKAVEQTAPMALTLYSLVVVWFHKTGHQWLRFPFRPWYAQKEEPSFADMLTTLRRVSYEGKNPHNRFQNSLT